MLPLFFCFFLEFGLDRSNVSALPRFPGDWDWSEIDTLRPGLVEWKGEDGSLRERQRDCVIRLCSELVRSKSLRGGRWVGVMTSLGGRGGGVLSSAIVISGWEVDKEPALPRMSPFLSKLDSRSSQRDGERKSVSSEPIMSAISLLAFSSSRAIFVWSICSSFVMTVVPSTTSTPPSSVWLRRLDDWIWTAIAERTSQQKQLLCNKRLLRTTNYVNWAETIFMYNTIYVGYVWANIYRNGQAMYIYGPNSITNKLPRLKTVYTRPLIWIRIWVS